MRDIARTARRPAAREKKRAAAVNLAVQNEHATERRQLERSVSWTGGERLRLLWYRLRLAIAEMNYATRRMTELQMRLPGSHPQRP